MKKRVWVWILAVLALTALAAGAVVIFLLPYRDARSEMAPDAALSIKQLEDGTLELSWPEAEKADYYRVEVLIPAADEKEEPQVLCAQDIVNGTCCILSNLPTDRTLTIQVNTMVGYSFPGDDKVRPGVAPVQTQLCLEPPAIDQLQWTAEPDTDSIHITFQMHEGDLARLFLMDDQGQLRLLRTLDAEETIVAFGESGDLPIPAHGDTVTLLLDSYREQAGSTYLGLPSEAFHVVREDLLDRNMTVQLTDEGDNVCTLTWSETKGEGYEVQLLDTATGEWVTVHTVEQAGERSYTSEHLPAFHDHPFRIVAVGGQTLPGQDYAAMSSTVHFQTEESVLYSTIWPIKDLEVYTTAGMTQSMGTVTAGSTLCVLSARPGVFAIRYTNGEVGYIDSNYCMIDLADYLGELCSYNITNSYSAMYKVHIYDIPYVTGKVVTGYEHVRMADGTYLVPLLYPTAQKLLKAALAAQEAGYRLKIYDAYRPNRATVLLYDRAEQILEDPVPGNIPDANADNEEKLLTYGKVMTNDVYNLGYFLARGASLHNLGIAVDLTIEKLDTGEELPMQSAMHDLSYYSMLYRNNANANILAEFMTGAGLGDLVSEWWHFQDNDIRQELSLPALWNGVSPEGWKADDNGWRYRYADGTYAAGCTLTLAEREYSFDDRGYLIEN